MKHIYAAILSALCMVLIPHQAYTQKVIWSENFNSYTQINFGFPWSSVGGPNVFPWRCDIPYITFGLSYIDFENGTKIAATMSNGMTDDVLLITPSINLGTTTGAFMSYDSYFLQMQNGGKTESAQVEVSTDNGTTWTALKQAPLSRNGRMARSYVDLSAYNGSAVRLGFRYSDSLKNMFGWMVDNISVFIPAANDIALIHADPEDSLLGYHAIPASTTVSGAVMNTGTSPITSFTISYQEGGGVIRTHTVNGVNIAPFDTLRFVHSIPHSIATLGRHSLKVWASLAQDTIRNNDTMSLILRGAQFMPDKKLTIEEGTATWSTFSPRGIVYMHAFDTTDSRPTRICVHSEDVMAQESYADYLYQMDQAFLPYFLFDRRGPVKHREFFEQYAVQKNYFGFADIQLQAKAIAGQITADATVRPAVDLKGQYRLALVITEDGVRGTGKNYEQANGFSDNRRGPMGGFETKTDPIPASDMVYDYVARGISPSPEGRIGCLPTTMLAGGNYTCNLHGIYSSAWAFSKLNAVILLIRDSDSTILNSKTVPFRSLGVENIAQSETRLKVLPNPAGHNATVSFVIPAPVAVSIEISDITGRSIILHQANNMSAGNHALDLDVSSLPAGMYFVTLHAGGQKESIRLSVIH